MVETTVEVVSIEQALENRHEWTMRWIEPWPVFGPRGNELPAHITLSCSVHDAINMQRKEWADSGHGYGLGQDTELLLDFIEVHVAEIVQ